MKRFLLGGMLALDQRHGRFGLRGPRANGRGAAGRLP